MMKTIFLKVLSFATVMGGMVFAREEVYFRKLSTLPGLTPVCRLWNEVVSSRRKCAKFCAKDDQCILFSYAKTGNCITYCGIETDLEGTLGEVYIAIRGTNLFFFFLSSLLLIIL